MTTHHLFAMVAGVLALTACVPDFSGAACSDDATCPTGQVCRAGACTRDDGSGGGASTGGGTGTMGGGAAMGGGGATDGGNTEDAGVDAGAQTDGGVAQLVVDRTSFSFGAVTTGATSAPMTFTVTNLGGQPTGALSVTVSGVSAARFSFTTTCGASLGSGGTCQVAATFSPLTQNVVTASLDISGTPGGTSSVAMSGAGSGPANLVVAPMLHSFGDVTIGTRSIAKAFTVTNIGGSTSGVPLVDLKGLGASSYSVSNNGCPAALQPNDTCTLSLQFLPTSAGLKTATLEVTATPGGTTTANLTGTGLTAAALSLTPNPGTFASVVVGDNGMPATFTVQNSGGSPTASLGTVLSGDFQPVADLCVGRVVAAGSSCTISVRFTPTSTGLRQGSLTVTSGTLSAVSSLSGTGLSPAALSLTPSTQNFGSVATNDSTTATLTLRNTGGAPSGVPTIALTSSVFSQTNTCTGALAPGDTCTVTVRFAPTLGNQSAALNASASPGGAASSNLMGTGVAPGALSISPTPWSFGSIEQGLQSATQTFTVTNTGGSPTSAPAVSLTGADAAQFAIGSNFCSAAISAGGTCTIDVRFRPTRPGSFSSTLQVSAVTGGTVAAGLSGIGLASALLAITPSPVSFQDTVVGQTSPSELFTVTNTGDVVSGIITPTFVGAGAGHFAITMTDCTSLARAQTCTIRAGFAPTAAGTFSPVLQVAATPGGTTGANVSGRAITPAALTLVPATGSATSFGGVVIGSTGLQTYVLSNGGQQAAGPVSFTLTGADFSNPGSGTCVAGTALVGGGSCTIQVKFAPTVAGSRAATLAASGTPGGGPSLSLSGTGLVQATLTVSQTTTFGQVEVGTQPAAQTWTISNTGDVATGLTSMTTSNAAEILPLTDTCGTTVAAHGTCTITASFKPSTGGARGGSLTYTASPGGTIAWNMSAEGMWRLSLTPPLGPGALSTSDGRVASCVSGSTVAQCSALYSTGAAALVRARTSNGADAHFTSWVAPLNCAAAGFGYDCPLTMNVHKTATAAFRSETANVVFASSVTYPANLASGSSVLEYDNRCNQLATTAGINNTTGSGFSAWMSVSGSTAASRVSGTGAFRRMDGTLVATSRASLLAGSMLAQIDLDETGKRIPEGTASTWTSTTATGAYSTNNDCTGWTSLTTPAFMNRGRTAGGPGLWTDGTGSHTCGNTGTRIYCFGKTSTTGASFDVVPTAGKIAYLAPTYALTTNGGLAALDNHCNANKPAGYTSRSFVALAATMTASAASRLAPNASYYRPDGTLVGTTAQLQSEILGAGIWQTNTGAYVGGHVFAWTGASAIYNVATSTSNCGDWTQPSATGVLVGRVTSAATDFFDGTGVTACNDTTRFVYCVEL